MMGRALSFSSIVWILTATACGGGAASAGSGSTPPQESQLSQEPPHAEEASTDGDRRPPVTPNVEIHNACTEAVPIYFGEQPNGTTGDFVTLRGDGTSHVPRREHGELTVWIVDDKGFGLAHVKVTRRMKRVEIGPSCRTVHAD
jgi:hypothetical protein